MRAHFAPMYNQHQNLLDVKIQSAASTNVRLGHEIAQQREEIERLVTLVETLGKDLDGANEGMEGVEDGNGVEGLSARAREAEEVLIAYGG
jgi:predicted  nucleic acid-binding Zn-ribbon protein